MTHDELMVKINQRYWKMFNHNSQDQTESGIEHRTFIQNQYFALRAIVELHPMWTDYRYTETSKELVEFCGCCQEKWPCKTIQVIQEELGNG